MNQATMTNPTWLASLALLNCPGKCLRTYLRNISLDRKHEWHTATPIMDDPEIKASFWSMLCQWWGDQGHPDMHGLHQVCPLEQLWFNCYHKTYGCSPDSNDMTEGSLQTPSRQVARSNEGNGMTGGYHDSMSPGQRMSNIKSWRSYGSVGAQAPQVFNKRNVKVHITDHPKLSGKAKDWVPFERKFRSVASVEWFNDVLMVKGRLGLRRLSMPFVKFWGVEYKPNATMDDKQKYEVDAAFIYDATFLKPCLVHFKETQHSNVQK